MMADSSIRPMASAGWPAEGPRQKLRVALLVLDNFTLNAFSGFVDALRLAADEGGRSRQIECGWVIVGRGPVRASCGLTVIPEREPSIRPAWTTSLWLVETIILNGVSQSG